MLARSLSAVVLLAIISITLSLSRTPIPTIASNGDGGPPSSADLLHPTAVILDTAGNYYIADTDHCRVRKVTLATGFITTVAGTGTCGFSGDGTGTSVALNRPRGIAVDGAGILYIAAPTTVWCANSNWEHSPRSPAR